MNGQVATEANVYCGPRDWRLLPNHSNVFVEQFAKLIISEDLQDEAAAYIAEAQQRPEARARCLITELCRRAQEHQRRWISSLLETWLAQTEKTTPYTTSLLIAEYIMFERFNDEEGMDNVIRRWDQLEASGRISEKFCLRLLRGEPDGEVRRRPGHGNVRHVELTGEDEMLKAKARELVLTDRIQLLALPLAEFAHAPHSKTKAGLLFCYLFRMCRRWQTAQAIALLDEFEPKSKLGRAASMLNELAVMCLKFGDHREYVRCFLRAAELRRRKIVKPDWTLTPYRFEYLMNQSSLYGLLTISWL